MWETQVWSLRQEDPLEKRMTTHSSILARRISWTQEPGGLQSLGTQRIGHDWASNTHTHTHNEFGITWSSHRTQTGRPSPSEIVLVIMAGEWEDSDSCTGRTNFYLKMMAQCKRICLPKQEMQEIWIQLLGGEDPLEEEMATQLQYSYLDNPMDRGTWWVTDHGIAETQLSVHIQCSSILLTFLWLKQVTWPHIILKMWINAI